MDDKDLIHQTLAGNMNAFTFLVKKYQNLVANMVFRIVQQRDDVQDVCQEVFIKVHKHLAKFKGDSKLSTWIASIAYNTSVSYVQKHRKHISLDWENEGEAFSEINHNSPQLVYEKSEQKKLIRQKVDELPAHFRSIISLYHLEEFSYKEIEEITGMPEGTVKTHLYRARKMLKESLSFVKEE